MYEEYVKNPQVTKQRMFYETMEDVLPRLKVIIDGTGKTSTILPLDSFTGSGTAGSLGGQQETERSSFGISQENHSGTADELSGQSQNRLTEQENGTGENSQTESSQETWEA